MRFDPCYNAHPALITDFATLTYADLEKEIAERASSFQKSQCVPFLAPSTLSTIVQLFGLIRVEAIACPLSTRLPSLDPYIKRLPAHLDEECATLLFTSGSTAEPKIACHSLANHIYSAIGFNTVTQLTYPARWLHSLPLFHVGGIAILFRSFLAGSAVVLSERPLLDAVLEHAITHLSLVPTQLYRLLEQPPALIEKCAAQLQFILIGGGPTNPALLQKAHSCGLKCYTSYGLTEMSSLVTLKEHPPLPFREISLAPDGEILVRGQTLFKGYYTKEHGIALPVDDEGWFHTCDLSDAQFTTMSRKDNLFISGGENIQPEEIERALYSLPGVIEALIIPCRCSEFGARPVAFLHSEQPYTLDQLRDALAPHLPRFKLPIKLLPFPESSSLKVSRASLKNFLETH